MKTARFWDYINGSPVKISLRDGQELNHCVIEYHEEGSESQLISYSRDGNEIYKHVETWGRDCDGGYGHSSALFCFVDNLAARPARVEHSYWERDWVIGDSPAMPDWQCGDSEQYDEYAELSGY